MGMCCVVDMQEMKMTMWVIAAIVVKVLCFFVGMVALDYHLEKGFLFLGYRRGDLLVDAGLEQEIVGTPPSSLFLVQAPYLL